jgi:hypothetical protein
LVTSKEAGREVNPGKTAYMYVCVYVWMDVCMYVLYAGMYVCMYVPCLMNRTVRNYNTKTIDHLKVGLCQCFVMTVNQNYKHEEIKNRLKSWNSGNHSVQNLFTLAIQECKCYNIHNYSFAHYVRV